MKKSLAIAVGAAALFAVGMPMAQNAKVPASNHGAAAMQADASSNTGGQMGQMNEHMKRMQALHDRMTTANSSEERQKVMDEQRKEMQGGMAMMTPMTQGGGMMGGMGSGAMGQKAKPADAGAQMQMMQKRMDMMQMMMQAMMDQQGVMPGPKASSAVPKT